MNLYLFCGFLGSGKTTLVVQLAKYLVSEKQAKVMLIVNDVGDVGIDAQLMRKMHTDVHELFGGCICGQLGNLVNLLLGVGDKYDVDTVLVEASGIAQPVRFIDTIRKFVPDDNCVHTITLVDASRFEELTLVLTELINSQISSADLAVINKIDAVDEQTLLEVEDYVRKLRPDVRMIRSSSNNPEDVHAIGEVMINEL